MLGGRVGRKSQPSCTLEDGEVVLWSIRHFACVSFAHNRHSKAEPISLQPKPLVAANNGVTRSR